MICFFKSFSVNAQAYEPLLGTLNEWHITSCFGGCNTSTYYTDGDTIVDGKNCKILDGFHYISRTFLLREDILERKVYLLTISPTKTSEFLLYDFSLEVGDSMELLNPVSPYPLLAGYYVLDSIVSRPLEDLQLYRHFYLSPVNSNTQTNENPVWVESVGSLSLINGPGSTPDFNGGGELSCYFKDGESRYLNMDSIQSCYQEHFLSLPELPIETPFLLYPNPSTQSFSIVSTNIDASYIQVVDIKGDEILNLEFVKGSFYFHSLQSGIYFIRLIGEYETSQPQKLVVRR